MHQCRSSECGGTNIYFRGFKILQTVLKSVKDKGMSNAQEVILTGCSGMAIKRMVVAIQEV